MSLKARFNEDMKAALRAGEKERLGVIRLINAAIKQREVDERIELDDTQVLGVLEKMLKQRRDSLAQYQAAAREDLANVERFEIQTIQAYLPAQLDEAELDAAVAAAIAEAGASKPQDIGKVMALLKPRLTGRADLGLVSGKVRRALSG